MPPCAGHKEQRLFLSHDNLEEIGFADSMGNTIFPSWIGQTQISSKFRNMSI